MIQKFQGFCLSNWSQLNKISRLLFLRLDSRVRNRVLPGLITNPSSYFQISSLGLVGPKYFASARWPHVFCVRYDTAPRIIATKLLITINLGTVKYERHLKKKTMFFSLHVVLGGGFKSLFSMFIYFHHFSVHIWGRCPSWRVFLRWVLVFGCHGTTRSDTTPFLATEKTWEFWSPSFFSKIEVTNGGWFQRLSQFLVGFFSKAHPKNGDGLRKMVAVGIPIGWFHRCLGCVFSKKTGNMTIIPNIWQVGLIFLWNSSWTQVWSKMAVDVFFIIYTCVSLYTKG